MISFWERQSFLHYDHIIIGAGIVGMSVALELRKKFPEERILILERGFMPTGASSRNAGFACIGSVTELLNDLKTMSETEVVTLLAARKKGLEILRGRLGDTVIEYEVNGSHELIDAQNLNAAVEQLDYLNALLLPVTGRVTYRLTNEKIAEFGLNNNYTKALIENTCEGALNTGKMLRALTDLCFQNHIEIKTGVEVSRFEEEANEVNVFIPDALRNEAWKLACRKLYICTNAFTTQLLPHQNVVPGRGQVLITKPIDGLKLKGIYHMDAGYYYFRELNGRVLLGGGRNMDFETETTTELKLNDVIQTNLDKVLSEIILPGTPFEVEQRWSGIMAFGNTKTPIVTAFSDKVYGAFRMGGMGVALGSEVAERLVNEVN